MRAKSGTVRFVEGRHALEKNLDINVIFFLNIPSTSIVLGTFFFK